MVSTVAEETLRVDGWTDKTDERLRWNRKEISVQAEGKGRNTGLRKVYIYTVKRHSLMFSTVAEEAWRVNG